MLMLTKKQNGFTIVELLIVIVVVAILAAISVVAYTGIQNRAYDSVVESDISAIIKNLEIARNDLGHYPRSLDEFPEGFKLSKSAYDTTNNNIYYIASRVNDEYAFGLRSKTGKGYRLTNSGLQQDVSVTASNTAAAIGADWDNSTDNFRFYAHLGVNGWNTVWSWTR